MKRKINLSTTISKFRALPVEISFEQVEQWVNNAPKMPTTNQWLPNWLLKLVSWRSFN